MKSICIIVVTYNSLKYIKNFLDNIYSSTDLDFELIIYDNNSQDGTVEFLKKIKSNLIKTKIIFSDKNINFGPANNYVIFNEIESESEYILFLNNDIEFKKGWLENLANCMIKSNADVVGAKLVYPNNTIQHCGIKFDICGMPHHIYRFASKDLPEVNKQKEFPNVTAACMLMKRQDFIDVGGFDEKYINGYEDNDLCMKLWLKNKKIVYEPNCELIHYESVCPGISDNNILSGNYFFNRWKNITLPIGLNYLKKKLLPGEISVFGAGEKCRQLLSILNDNGYKVKRIYDRKYKKINFWNKSVGDLNNLLSDKPDNLIVASIAQYSIIRNLKTLINFKCNLIPICEL
jgi:GT2 family glycosyltransferase